MGGNTAETEEHSSTSHRPPGDAGTPRPRQKRRWLWLLPALLLIESLLPPAWQPTAHLGLGLIHAYQTTTATLGTTGIRCRFQPTCSRYAEQAISEEGTLRGGVLAAWRILRCGPWAAELPEPAHT